MRSPLLIVPGRLAFVGSALGRLAYFSLLLCSDMSIVSGSSAARAWAVSLSIKVMAKRCSPTVDFHSERTWVADTGAEAADSHFILLTLCVAHAACDTCEREVRNARKAAKSSTAALATKALW